MEQLPVFYNLKGRKVVVTGGGTVAARRTEISLRSGGQVTVFADALGDEFDELFSDIVRMTPAPIGLGESK